MIYKYTAANNYALQNLRDQVIICRHHADFNDPFEFWSRFVSGIPHQTEKVRFKAAFEAWGFPDIDVDNPPEDWTEYFESLVNLQPNFVALFEFTKVACFCSSPSNLLMWSHYADGLRGLCVGFNEQKLKSPDRNVYLTDVEYVSQPPFVDSFVYAVAVDQEDYHLMAIEETTTQIRYADYKELPGERDAYKDAADTALSQMRLMWRRAFAAKPLEWAYEQEVRLLLGLDKADAKPDFLPYAAEAVEEVIVGERMQEEFGLKLRSLLSSQFPQVRLRRAIRNRDCYRIDVVDWK